MPEKHVSVTLTFATDTHPTLVAMGVGNTLATQLPENLTGISWHGFEVDEAEEDADGDA